MSGERRRIVANGELPVYITRAGRIANLDADVRKLADELRRTITDKAQTLVVQGYELDEESWEVATTSRSVVMSAVVKR